MYLTDQTKTQDLLTLKRRLINQGSFKRVASGAICYILILNSHLILTNFYPSQVIKDNKQASMT